MFIPDQEAINKFISGDLGIADELISAILEPILSAIDDEEVKQSMLDAFNGSTGLKGIEKTIITSAIESYKPIIELVKILLELFSVLEDIIARILSAPNPAKIEGTFSYNIIQQSKANNATSAIADEDVEPKLPEKIFLFRMNGETRGIEDFNSNHQNILNLKDKEYFGKFDVIVSKEDMINKRNAIIDAKVESELDRVTIKNEANSKNDEEWDSKEETKQLKKLGVSSDFQYYINTKTIIINEKELNIDIENDYDVSFYSVQVNEGGKDILVYPVVATLKPEIKQAQSTGTTSSNLPKEFPAVYTPAHAYTVPIVFIERALPIVLDKLTPLITAIKEILTDPPKFLNTIIQEKLKDNIEIFNPDFMASEKEKAMSGGQSKYFLSDGSSILDGSVFIPIPVIGFGFEFKDAKLDFISPTDSRAEEMKTKIKEYIDAKKAQQQFIKDNPDSLDDLPEVPEFKTQPLLEAIIGMVTMPINLIKGIIEAVIEFIKKLAQVFSLPTTVKDFLSFQFVKDLIGLDALLGYVGIKLEKDDNGKVIGVESDFIQIPKNASPEDAIKMVTSFFDLIIKLITQMVAMPIKILGIEDIVPIPELKIPL